ncbi:MAG: 4Fe-4S dicluster domain-containing protein [Nanoarchaeota archaeon]
MSFENINGYKLPKKKINKFLKYLEEFGKVYAPTNKNNWIHLEEFNNPKDITFEGLSWYSAKKHVLKQKDILFEFNNNQIIKSQDNEKKVLFGLRLCDLNSFRINDVLFLKQNPKHENYEQRRKNLLLIGLWCDKPIDEYCFCDSLNLENYYDLCLFDRGKYFHIKTGSLKGLEIVNNMKLDTDTNYSPQIPRCKNKLLTIDIAKYFNRDDIWQKGATKCLSCGNCTSLCPTCLCFDIEDEVNLDLVSGKRISKWDSCMYRDFTLVAGNNVFRDERLKRFKHRFYHKLDYFKKKTNMVMCTGCGRCIRGCPTKIDWIELINKLEVETK